MVHYYCCSYYALLTPYDSTKIANTYPSVGNTHRKVRVCTDTLLLLSVQGTSTSTPHSTRGCSIDRSVHIRPWSFNRYLLLYLLHSLPLRKIEAFPYRTSPFVGKVSVIAHTNAPPIIRNRRPWILARRSNRWSLSPSFSSRLQITTRAPDQPLGCNTLPSP